jgi:hypothetical protein
MISFSSYFENADIFKAIFLKTHNYFSEQYVIIVAATSRLSLRDRYALDAKVEWHNDKYMFIL